MSRSTTTKGGASTNAQLAALAHWDRYIPTIGHTQPSVQVTAALAGLVYFSPILIKYPVTIDRLGIHWATPAAGNFYLALYDSTAEAPVNRLAVTGNTAAAGINRKQQVAIVPATLSLDPGLYFLANVHDAFNESFWSNIPVFTFMQPAGVTEGPSWYQENLGGYGIPAAVATPVQQYDHPILLWVRVSSVP